jgi:nitrate reductase beta subunit
MNLKWGSNWEDDLAGATSHATGDPDLAGLEEKVRLAFEQVFMFYLPRICEHCLNPSCVASCPSGAMYKREEDGIVLVDQDRCRGWRYCVSGCPYKKVYFNHRTGKAEKCTLCFPRIEAGQPTICSETCVGRLRYLGLFLYDADRVLAAAATEDPQGLYEAQLSVFLDPEDPAIAAEAARQGIPADWIDAARRSPVYALAVRHKVALPLHPEYRTLPMVWYIPPLSPVADVVSAEGYSDENPDRVFAAIDALRIPAEYLANLFTAGDADVIRIVLRKLAALRALMRAKQLGLETDAALPASVGATEAALEELYRLLAIAKYDDRYVIPPAHAEDAGLLMAQHEQLFCAQPGGDSGPDSFHPGTSGDFRDDDGRLHLDLSPRSEP